MELFKEANTHQDEMLKEIQNACMRLWTSALTINTIEVSKKKEFCSILNDAIINDVEDCMKDVAYVVRAITKLCVGIRQNSNLFKWPTNNILYRGSSLPSCHESFFTVGTKYRCPSFLATSENKSICDNFLDKARDKGENPVMWYFHLDPINKCCHANYVFKSHYQNEKEFLFNPYSVFQVISTDWIRREIHISVMYDNTEHPEDLPLAPWH